MPKVELMRYGLMGGIVTAVYLTLSNGLVLAGGRPVAASFVAYVIAATLSYLGHRSYTFHASQRHRRAVPRFAALSLAGLAIAITVPALLERTMQVSAWASFFIVSGLIASLSFVAMRLAVFSDMEDEQVEEEL